jgi:plasmid stability protein
MAQLIVRKLDDDVKERLKARAKKHGRSLEAEARAILQEATIGDRSTKRRRKEKKGFGTLMAERFKDVGLTDAEWKLFNEGIEEINRGWTIKPADFDK